MGGPALSLRRAGAGIAVVGSVLAALATAHTAWNLRALRRPAADPDVVGEPVSLLVPARDEVAQIRSCLQTALASTDVPDLEVLVLDDCSTDATAAVVRSIAATDPRLRLVEGAPLPRGWVGKPWACAQLAAQARGSVLVFLDADVRLAPHGLAATVGLLRETGLALVSPYPRQLADGLLPRLVQPLLQWSWLSFLPLRAAQRSSRPSLSAANGQLLACDAGAYRRTGGHSAVAGSMLEDVELLKAFKRNGLHGVVADGTAVAQCRMYDSGPDLVAGYTKSLWAAFSSPVAAASVVAVMSVTYVAPPLGMVVARGGRLRAVGALGYLAGVGGRALVARRTGQQVLPDVLAHPASIAVLGWLVARSWRARRTGRLAWRGRPIGPAAR